MIPEPFDQTPRFAGVPRHEERRGLDAAEEDVRLGLAARNDLPHPLQRSLGSFRKFYVRFFGIRPVLPEIIARSEQRAPMHALRSGPDAAAAVTIVVRHRVDSAAWKIRAADLPFFARRLRAKNERAFHRADEDQEVALFGFDVTSCWH